MKFRPYQTEAMDASLVAYKQWILNQLLVLPTGTGKTVVFNAIPKHHEIKGQTIVLIHRRELLEQAIEKYQRWNPGVSTSIEMAGDVADPSADFVVCSVPTLGRAGSARIKKFDPSRIGCVIVDEAHHATAQSYLNIFNEWGLLNKERRTPESARSLSKPPLLFGVTATPNRADGSGLGQIFDKIVYEKKLVDAIAEGWLSKLRAFAVTTKTDLDGVSVVQTPHGRDFKEDELAATVNTPERNRQLVEAYGKHGEKRKGVYFCVNVQHIHDLVTMFNSLGIKAQGIWGDDPDRKKKLADHQAGKFPILVNCGILTEGYDDWSLQLVGLARPTKSPLLLAQMIGRVTRLQDGVDNLLEAMAAGTPLEKTDGLILDAVDNTKKHTLATVSSLFGIPKKVRLKGDDVVGTLKTIEQAQLAHPDISFDDLEDIAKLDYYIEQVDLFAVKFPQEVLDNSELQWHKISDGSLSLLLGKDQFLTLKENLLGRWEIRGAVLEDDKDPTSKRSVISDDRDSLKEAFYEAELWLAENAPGRNHILTRQAKWHDGPVTEKQMKMVKWLSRSLKRPMPTNLSTYSKGQASLLIGKLMALRQT